MADKPIIFSTEMVKAILDGRKTQTRRVIKPQPDEDGLARDLRDMGLYDTGMKQYKCPYGDVGDTIWVRETFAIEECVCVSAQGYRSTKCHMCKGDVTNNIIYKAGKDGVPAAPWKPSIHMPKWASRITLKITDISVERLQNISETDAICEGIANGAYAVRPVTNFFKLWDSINAKRSYPWESNPWVWVITFKPENPQWLRIPQ